MITPLRSAGAAAQQPAALRPAPFANPTKAAGAPATAASETSAPSLRDPLRESAKALEGMFVAQLFKAMRATVPQQEGFVSGGSGEEIFTALMDEHLAAETPKQWEGGLAEALYRQLQKALPAPAGEAPESHPASTLP